LNAATSDGAQFIPLVLELPEGIDLSKAQIKLSYNASDPGSDVSVAADGTYSIVGGGSLRLWTKDGSVVRDRRDISACRGFCQRRHGIHRKPTGNRIGSKGDFVGRGP